MKYQKSIQVLRGLSIVAVLGYHFGVPGFSNGFLGVDIFFVISGYLMILIYENQSAKEFYIRRARRLLPAYVSTLGLVVAVSFFRIIPSDFSQLLGQVRSTLLLSPNLYFWSQNSYFQNTDFNPLLNLWSLGVELHFYIFFPIIYMLIKRSNKTIPIISTISLIVCFATITLSPKTAFFLLPFRLWEFLFGCLLANLKISNRFTKMYLPRHKISLILISVIFSLFPINGFSQSPIIGHPGLASLLIVLAIGPLLLIQKNALLFFVVLDNIFEWIGKYSYSLYLIHFPLLVLYNYEVFSGTNLETDSNFELIIILSITFLLAILQYHFIEQFFRKPVHFQKFIVFILLFGVPLIFIASDTHTKRFTPIEQNISRALTDRPSYRCGKIFRFVNPFSNLCQLTNHPGRDRVLLFGNSHADAIKDSFVTAANRNQVNVFFWASNNPLSLNSEEIRRVALEISSSEIQVVYFHFSPGGWELEKLNELIQALKKSKISSHILSPIPVWEESVPKVLWNHTHSDAMLPLQTYSDYRNRNQYEIDFLDGELTPVASYTDLASVLCTPYCQISDSNMKPYYFDGGHLTKTGAGRLEETFIRLIRQNILKPSSVKKF